MAWAMLTFPGGPPGLPCGVMLQPHSHLPCLMLDGLRMQPVTLMYVDLKSFDPN
jgi:hypothetical protein